MTGQSLELFYVDGRPDGIVTAEMFNWTGSVLLAPRTDLSRTMLHPQARHSGVYLLVGEDHSGTPLAYIGEGEDVAARIRNHDVNKDWWTQVAIVTAAENRLNKAHIRYLESRLIERANQVGRMPLENGNRPALPSLSPADVSKMEAFLTNLLIVLPALRIDMFVERKRKIELVATRVENGEPGVPEMSSLRFRLENSRQRLSATAVLVDGEFIVLKGSQSRKAWSEGSAGHSYAEMYAELCRSEVLVEEGEHRVFAQDYAFASPSAAAAAVNGRPSNGTLEWREIETGQTYKDWERQRLKAMTEAALT
jgi:hypothetical protein